MVQFITTHHHLVEYLTGQQLVFSLLLGVLVVDAVGDLSLEVGQSVSWIRAAGLLPEPRLPDLLQHDPLQVSALLSQQLQSPEVSQPQLTIPIHPIRDLFCLVSTNQK